MMYLHQRGGGVEYKKAAVWSSTYPNQVAISSGTTTRAFHDTIATTKNGPVLENKLRRYYIRVIWKYRARKNDFKCTIRLEVKIFLK